MFFSGFIATLFSFIAIISAVQPFTLTMLIQSIFVHLTCQGSTFRKKSWGQVASKFSFLVARTSILVAKNCLSSRKNRIQYTKGLLINLNKIVNIKLQKVNPEYKRRPSTKQAT